MNINLETIKEYQKLFYSGDWLKEYRDSNSAVIENIRKRTDLLISGDIVFNDCLDMEACEIPYPIDNYKWNSYPSDDPEWLYMLSRQGFMVDLAIRYKIDEDKCFLEFGKTTLLDFINNNGVPNDNNRESWRPLDSGLRLFNWLKSLLYLPLDTLFTEEEWDLFNRSINIHCNHSKNTFIEKYYLSNWGILSLSGTAMKELFSCSKGKIIKKNWVWLTFERMINLQFFKDGIHWEQSPLYQHEVVNILTYLLQISEYLQQKLPFNLRELLKKPIQATHYQANNQKVLNAINDSDQVDFGYVYDYYCLLGFLPMKLKTYQAKLYAGSMYDGDRNIHLNNIFAEIDSGFLSYKSESYFTLINGWHGSSHGHASTGSFTFQIDDYQLLIDSGRYSYVNNKLRIFLKGESAHNTLRIPGHPGTNITSSWTYSSLSEPIGKCIYPTSFGFYSECSWLSGEDIIFKRQFIYIKEIQVLIILDQIFNKFVPFVADFHYADNLNIYLKNSNKIIIKNNKRTFKHYFFNGQGASIILCK